MRRFLPRWLGPRRGPENIFWITPTLAVGGSELARDPLRLRHHGICAVLDVQAEAGDRSDRFSGMDIAYLKVPVIDFAAPDQDQLDRGTEWVIDRMQGTGPVFVHCRAGLGRSVTFALATLVRIGYDLPQSYNMVRGARASIALSEPQIAALKLYAKRVRSA